MLIPDNASTVYFTAKYAALIGATGWKVSEYSGACYWWTISGYKEQLLRLFRLQDSFQLSLE